MTPEVAAKQFIDSLSPEAIQEIKDDFANKIQMLLDGEQKKLDDLLLRKANLEKEKQDLYDQEKTAASEDKYAIFTKRNLLSIQIKAMEYPIMGQRNIVLALKNGGGITTMEDKKGEKYDNIADFTDISSEIISFDEETILTDTPPPYIPFINEYVFKSKGYVFDAIRISPNRYIFAPNGYQEENNRKDVVIGDLPKEHEGYILVTLDQLALISDYYYTKAKAMVNKDAGDSNIRNEERWDKLPDAKKESFLNQKGLYHSLPAKIKKTVTQEVYSNLTWQEKEKIYKFYKRTGAKRLVSKLDDKHMWKSFHNMYERFIDPSAVAPKPGFANHEVFVYWEKFRDMMDWKIKDIKIQRETESEVRKIALETSFGDSNTSDLLKQELGIFVKRQDGSKINAAEIDQIKEAWVSVEKIFGKLSFNANEDNLKISHTGLKYVFASKSAGMYIPSMRAIAVTNKFGDEQFRSTLSHEIAHWFDGLIGKSLNRRHASGDYESTAGQIAYTFKKNLNVKSDSDYINSSVECFARAFQQYYAIETNGEDARLYYSYVDLHGNIPFFIQDNYVSKQVYDNKLKPLIEAFLEENKELFIPISNTGKEDMKKKTKYLTSGAFDTIEYVTKNSKSKEDAFEKVSKIKNIDPKDAEAFRKKYDPQENLSPREAFYKYYNEVNNIGMKNKEPISNSSEMDKKGIFNDLGLSTDNGIEKQTQFRFTSTSDQQIAEYYGEDYLKIKDFQLKNLRDAYKKELTEFISDFEKYIFTVTEKDSKNVSVDQMLDYLDESKDGRSDKEIEKEYLYNKRRYFSRPSHFSRKYLKELMSLNSIKKLKPYNEIIARVNTKTEPISKSEEFNKIIKSIKPSDLQFFEVVVYDGSRPINLYFEEKDGDFIPMFGYNEGNFGEVSAMGIKPLTAKQEEDLYAQVEKGSVQVEKIPTTKYANAGMKREVLIHLNPTTARPELKEVEITLKKIEPNRKVVIFKWRNNYFRYNAERNPVNKSIITHIEKYDLNDKRFNKETGLPGMGAESEMIYNSINSNMNTGQGELMDKAIQGWGLEFAEISNPKVTPEPDTIESILIERGNVSSLDELDEKLNHAVKNVNKSLIMILSEDYDKVIAKFPSVLKRFLELIKDWPERFKFLPFQNDHNNEFANEFYGNLKENIFNLIPDEYKKLKAIKPVPFRTVHEDENIKKLLSGLASVDSYKPAMNGVYFDDKGVTSTDGHRMMFVKRREKGENGLYCFSKKCFTNNSNNEVIDEKFPDYAGVLALSYNYVISSVNLEAIRIYLTAFQKAGIPNNITHRVTFYYSGQRIDFNAELFIEGIEAFMKLGYKKADIGINEPNRAVVFSPEGRINEVHGQGTDFFLIMPVMSRFQDQEIPSRFYFDLNSECIHTDGIDEEVCLNPVENEKRDLIKIKEDIDKSKAEIKEMVDKNKEIKYSFFNYIKQFYGQDVDAPWIKTFPPKGASDEEIMAGINEYHIRDNIKMSYLNELGDSVDREKVRDIMIENRSKTKGSAPNQEYLDAISGAEVLLEMAEGKEKEELQDYIDGLKTMLEL